MKVIQITDLHLHENRTKALGKVVTWDSFEAVLSDIDTHHGDFDLLVITGDIAHDEALPTYQALRETLGTRLSRCRLIPGNHDNREYLSATFISQFCDGTSTLDFVTQIGGWRIVGLDTQVTGEVHGQLTDPQVDWLRVQLESEPMPTLVFLHHPPGPIGVEWLDAMSLRQHPEFVKLIAQHNVHALVAGHVHQAAEGQVAGTAFYTTPSTCMQFGSGPDREFLTAGYGYRTFDLTANSMSTAITRVTPLP
jgi:3',5'-cyclic-AMP phosphodiesterase